MLFVFLGWSVGSRLVYCISFLVCSIFFGNLFFGLLYLVFGIFFSYFGKTSTILYLESSTEYGNGYLQVESLTKQRGPR